MFFNLFKFSEKRSLKKLTTHFLAKILINNLKK